MDTHQPCSSIRWYSSALLAAFSFSACRSPAPNPDRASIPEAQTENLQSGKPSEHQDEASVLPELPEQTLTTLRETYGKIVAADRNTSPLLTQGLERFLNSNGVIRISINSHPEQQENSTFTVSAQNYAQHKLLVYQYCLQERLRNNPLLASLFKDYGKNPDLLTRVEQAIVRGVRRSPDNLIIAYSEALSIFADNGKPLGTIQDFRVLLTSVNTQDGPAMKIVEKIRRSIHAGTPLELKSTAPNGAVQNIIVTAENIEEYGNALNSALFSMRAKDNLVIQSLIAKEEYGELDPLERIVLQAIRNHPDDGAATYKEAEQAFLIAQKNASVQGTDK